jgi:hypothetical protein
MLVFTQNITVQTLNGVKEFKEGDTACNLRCDILEDLKRNELVVEKAEPKKAAAKPATKAKKAAPENKAIKPEENKDAE